MALAPVKTVPPCRPLPSSKLVGAQLVPVIERMLAIRKKTAKGISGPVDLHTMKNEKEWQLEPKDLEENFELLYVWIANCHWRVMPLNFAGAALLHANQALKGAPQSCSCAVLGSVVNALLLL